MKYKLAPKQRQIDESSIYLYIKQMRMKALLSLILIILSTTLEAQNVIDRALIAGGYQSPVDIVFDHNDHMFVVEKRGRVRIFKNDGTKEQTPYLDISDRVNSGANERGLFSLAFAPDYETTGYFFVHYSGNTGQTVVSRFRATGELSADAGSEEILLVVEQPYNNHNGGKILFGKDDYLYIALGDGGSGGDPENRSQNRQDLLGKMLRIDVSTVPYTIPPDNPFANDDQTLDEIWGIGLRNPWKFVFDPLTGDMYIADVGQSKWEEVHYTAFEDGGGHNFGWRCYEGFAPYKPAGCGEPDEYLPPVHVYANNDSADGCSITGGAVYRGTEIPFLSGKYVYGDFCSGKMWSLHMDECGKWQNQPIFRTGSYELSTFGQDRSGEVYFGELGSGNIYMLTEKCRMSFSLKAIGPTCKGNEDGSIDLVTNDTDLIISIVNGQNGALKAGTYEGQVMNSQGCSQPFCIEVPASSFDYPEITGLGKIELCSGETFAISPPLTAGYPALRIKLYRDSVLVDDDWDQTSIGLVSGRYSIVLYDENCSAPNVEIFELNIVELPQLEISVSGDSLVTSREYAQYEWFEDGATIPGATDYYILNFKSDSEYVVTGITAEGCVNSSEPFFTSAGDEVVKIRDFKLSPNPSSNLIYIESKRPQSEEGTISILNTRGIMVYKGKGFADGKNQEMVDIVNLPSGKFFVVIQIGNKRAVLPFIKN